MQAWLSFLSALSQSAGNLGHRQVIMLSGPLDWSWPLLKPWLNQHRNNSIISQTIPEGTNGKQLQVNKPSNLLGYESDSVVFNCHDGLYPDALTAISGTLVCGGILFILCPDTERWPTFADDFAKNRAPHVPQTAPPATNFHMVKRLLEKGNLHNVQLITPESQLPCPPSMPSRTWQTPAALTGDQERVHKLICDTFNQQNYTHVITADRGRGKSHLLGKLLYRLMSLNVDNGIKCYLTAPNKTACQAIYKSLEQSAPSMATQITFIPPEKVLSTVSRHDILIVDEAASLPVNVLIQYSTYFNKLILATTTHGYEGTGKGFQVRFFAHLNNLNSSNSTYYHLLTNPVRYSNTDPLEHWLFDAFCLNSEPNGLSLNHKQLDRPMVKLMDQHQLAADNQLLEEVFGLLVQAHYQTRPSDLRDILDAPGFKLFALLNGHDKPHTVLAACLISDEGPVLNTTTDTPGTILPLHTDILNGLRRPKGHLMPQVLAHHMGLVEALTLKGARIIRIATLPNLQQQNLGSQLLSSVSEHLNNKQYDYLGSSYADTQDVRSFWLKNKFTRVRIGNKQDAASGTHSALTLKGLSPRGIRLEKTAEAMFLRSTKQIDDITTLTENESQMLDTFLSQRGSYEYAKQLLARFKGWNLLFPKKASKEFKQQVSNWLYPDQK